MTLQDFVRLLRRSWILIVTFALFGVAAGAAITVTATPQYTASTRLFVSIQSPGTTVSDVAQGNSAAQQKVTSYADVVTSAKVLQPVIDKLDLDMSLGQLAGRVTATSPVNTVLIDITVQDSVPDRAARLADAIGASFTDIVTDTLETPTSGGPSLVKIATIEPAAVPTTATSPDLRIDLAIGLLAGLVAGLGIAVLRNALDTRTRSQQDVEAVTDLPILGGIAFDPGTSKRPLVVQVDPRSPRAESFRTLRTNVQFTDLDEQTKSFTVTSALPSEGKSTTAANLAIVMAENGARVALVDADLRRPRLAELLGIEGAVGLTDVLIGAADLDDVLQPWGRGGLTVLPAGRIPPNPSELLGSKRMRDVLDRLSERFDEIIIDAPPLLPVTDAAVLSRLTDATILITAAKATTRNQLQVALDALHSVGSHTVGVVMTMVPTRGTGAYGYGYGSYAAYYSRTPREEATQHARPRGRRAAPRLRRRDRKKLARQQ